MLRLGLPTGTLAWADDALAASTPLNDLAVAPVEPPVSDSLEALPQGPVPDATPSHVVTTPLATTPIALFSRRRVGFISAGLVAAAALALAAGASFGRSPAAATSAATSDVSTPASAIAARVAKAQSDATASAGTARAPIDVQAMLDRALDALARGEVEAALTSYRAACVAAPDRADAYRGRGLAAARAGLDDEAIASLEHYLSLVPDAPDAERVRTRLSALRAHRGREAQRDGR